MPVPAVIVVAAVVLFLWGIITLVRRIAETDQARAERWRAADAWPDSRADAQARGRRDPRTGAERDDGIDWEELRRAEEEVRDLDPDAKPEEGWEGDDWGPGAPRTPPR